MTAREMQIAFEAWFDHASANHELVSDEIFRYINEAQDDIVGEMFLKFEQDQIVTDNLRVLVSRDQAIDSLYGGDDAGIGSFKADYGVLPSDYRYMIAARAEVKYNRLGVTIVTETVDVARTISGSSTTAQQLVKLSQSDDIYRLLLDPFNRTTYTVPMGVINGARLYVYTDSKFICEQFFVNYIRVPNTIALDGPVPCELPDNLHKDIVDRAIDRFLQRTSLLIPQKSQ